MKILTTILAIGLLLSVTGFSGAQSRTQEQVIAQVVMAVGEAAIVTANSRYEVVRRDTLKAGDRIVTGPDGQLHIRFSDGAIVSLRPDSELLIASFSFEQSATDHVLVELRRGALRVISGEIDGEAYTLQLPAGQVHPEAADFQAVIESEERHLLAAFNGSIVAASPAGQLRLGAGADADFGAISANEAPEWFDQPGNAVQADRILELK